jgi:hypothetical protein
MYIFHSQIKSHFHKAKIKKKIVVKKTAKTTFNASLKLVIFIINAANN